MRTDQFGQGYISIETLNRENQEIPINLAGKGMSKAKRKARGIVKWWSEQEEESNPQNALNKYFPYQKRASQRARKKLRNASRRTHEPSFSRHHIEEDHS